MSIDVDTALEDVEIADEVVGPASDSTKLALITPLEKIKAGLALFKTEGATATWDVSTTKGEEAARAYRARCVAIRTSADAAYEQGNKPILKIQADARKLRDAIKADVQEVENVWDAKIKDKEKRKAEEKAAREKAERERETAIRKAIADISASVLSVATANSSAIDAKLKEVQAIEITADSFGLFVDVAEGARLRATTELNTLLAKAVQREQEARRMEEQRQELARQQAEIDRQRAEAARLVREAEERAAAEQKRIDDARLAEERRVAEAAAAEEARLAEARAAEARRIEAERAERQRLDDEARQRREAEQAELKRQVDAFEEAKRVERERVEADRKREAQAEADRKAEAARIAAEREAAEKAAAEREAAERQAAIDAALKKEREDAEAAAELERQTASAPKRPSDEEILATLASAYDVDQLTVLVWINELDVAAERNRIGAAS